MRQSARERLYCSLSRMPVAVFDSRDPLLAVDLLSPVHLVALVAAAHGDGHVRIVGLGNEVGHAGLPLGRDGDDLDT